MRGQQVPRTRKLGLLLSRAAVVGVLLFALAAGLRSATTPLIPRAARFLRGHTDGVTAVAWSPDGETLASGSWDGTVRLWHTLTALSARTQTDNALGAPLIGHTGAVLGLAFGPGDTLLAYGRCTRWEKTWCIQGEIVLLDLAGTFPARSVAARPAGRTLADHEGIVESLAFSPDGQILASGSWGTSVRLWHTATGAPVGPPLTGHTNVDEQSRFFVLSGEEMMDQRAEYRAHIESIGGKYRDDMGGINWSTAFCFEDKWEILPGYKRLGHERAPDRQLIRLPTTVLDWSDWVAWETLAVDARGGTGVRVPNRKRGVYEVRRGGEKERLTIGKASDLRMRVKQGLVKGKSPHSAGDQIRAHENTAELVVRWAVTERPAAVEEALHKKHIDKFGHLPIYTQHT